MKVNKSTIKTILIIGIILLMTIINIFPIPAMMLDILLLLNLFIAFIFFLVMFFIRSEWYIPLPAIIIIFSITCFLIFINAARLILGTGTAFDGIVIKAVSSCFTSFSGSDRTSSLIAGLLTYAAIITVQTLIVIKWNRSLSEVAARFFLNDHPVKMMSIDDECYNKGRINQKEADLRKEDVKRETNFYEKIYNASNLSSVLIKTGLIILAVSIPIGITRGYFLHVMPINKAIITYSALFLSAYLLSFTPIYLFCIGVVMGTRFNLYKLSKTFCRCWESYVLETIDLEIGYKLIPLTDDVKSQKFDECLDDMRQEIKHDLGFDIPILHLSNKKYFGSSRYCIKYKGEVLGKGKIKANEDPAVVITAHLMEVIKKHDLRR